VKKPSILFYNFGARLGGAEIVLLKFLQHPSDTMEFKVLLNEYGRFYDKLVENNISVEVIETKADQFYSIKREDSLGLKNFQLIPALIRLFREVIRYFKQNQFDLIVSNTYKSHIILGLASKWYGFNAMWRFHDIIQRDYSHNQFSRANIALMKFLAPSMKKIVPVSQAVTDSFINFGFDPSQFIVVHNGIDVLPQQSKSIRSNSNSIRIGWIGQFAAWKGIEAYIHLCIEIIHAKDTIGREFEFIIAGSALFGNDDYAEHIKSMVTGEYEKYFKFLGHISDIDSFYNNIDVYFHTSIAPDPFPTTILEAGSRGLLVFASQLGGSGEIIDDQVTGYLIDMTDIQGTLVKVVDVLNNFSDEHMKGHLLQKRIGADLNTETYCSRFETEILNTLPT